MKTIKIIFVGFIALGLIFFMYWSAIGEEISYYKNAEYKTYTIEIELVTGSKKVITTSQAKDSHFQVNCSKTCHLQCLAPDGAMKFGRGHWITVRDAVVDFKILKVE